MYGPPRFLGGELAELVCRVGGEPAACRLLTVSRRTLRHWRRIERAPLWALRLLWYAGPDGRHAAAIDAENELRTALGLADALQAELQAARSAAAAAAAALALAESALAVARWRGFAAAGHLAAPFSGSAAARLPNTAATACVTPCH
jgi:hypothetical protein